MEENKVTILKGSWFQEFLLGTLVGALETIGESKLIEVLQKLHDSDITAYNAAISGGYALVTALQPLVAGSGTKIDDAFVNALAEAIAASAEANQTTIA